MPLTHLQLKPNDSFTTSNNNDGSSSSSSSSSRQQPPHSPGPWTPLTPGFFYADNKGSPPLPPPPHTPLQGNTFQSSSPMHRQPTWRDFVVHAPWRLLLTTVRKGHSLAVFILLFLLATIYSYKLYDASFALPLSTLQKQSHVDGSLTPASTTRTTVSPPSRLPDMAGSPSWWLPPSNKVEEAFMDLTRADGRILVKSATSGEGFTGRQHPIPELMKLGKRKWQEKLDKQSKSFEQAMKEYRRRYGRPPPKGFDQWYAWAKKHQVQLIDEYDLIEHDLHPQRAFSPTSFRARIEYCEDYFKFGWRLVVESGIVRREGRDKDHDRARAQERLIQPFAKYLPNMSMWVHGHDTAAIWRSWEETHRLSQLVAAGEYDDDKNGTDIRQKSNHLAHPHKFIATCPPESAMRQADFDFGKASKDLQAPFTMPQLPEGARGTFVGFDLNKYMDVCESPQYRHMHSGTSWTWPTPGPHCAIMTAGVHANFGDIRTIIPEQFDLKNPVNRPWSERSDSRLVWRGQTSGPVWTAEWPYLCSHRARLHLLSHRKEGLRSVLIADPNNGDSVQEIEYPNSFLNEHFLDTGMVGPPVQCSKEDGTCDKMHEHFQGFDPKLSLEEQDRYKFVLDIDGNSWSGRFKRLMASNAAVLKATVFREPWSDWIMPWVHYIPIQVDYSDMWNVLAFFRGEPGSMNGAHDELAEEIGRAGREWQAKYYRWEDLQSYQFRLLLEWGRLYNDGPMDYDGDEVAEPQLLRDRV